ncbi:MAG TPA: GC-type dockerin domain-anchored protein [Phycisphaerales bacterium]|nr:GC-type dockerin domain-anchored protein [Phycisphaerales bacterium]
MRSKNSLVALALLAGVAASGAAFGGAEQGVAAKAELMRRFPGVRAWEDGARTRVLYGVPMTTAPSARLAAEGWLAAHSGAFGVGELDLVEQWSGAVRHGDFQAFMYSQLLDGLPVETSPGRVLARDNGDGTWSVVYAAGVFAKLPEGGFAPVEWTAQEALAFIRASEFGRLPVWSGPQLVAWQPAAGAGNEAVRAWKFVGENPDRVLREKHTFFVDAATGALLEARDEVHNIDVFGLVKGYGSPGNLPDEAGNPPALLPVNQIRVGITGGSNAYTDGDGFFNIAHGGNSNVTISATFDTGMWCNINDQSGTPVQSASGTATPGQEAYLEFNPTPAELRTAQVNAFIHTGLIHNFISDRSGWDGMDFICQTNVNIASTCNAYFDGGSINFFRSGGGCVNSAYSTVVAHEYGHYIVARLGLSQGAFGEGYGDSCAEMLYDTGIIAEHFYLNGNPIRDNDNTIRTYPCSGGSHHCGQLLGGVWWHMRENFGATYGSEPGFEEVRQLFVDWSMITTGGSGENSAHPGTAIEVLTMDDTDGNVNNGTPNYHDICAAFGLHNVECPDLVPFTFAYPDGLPEEIDPNEGETVRVLITANSGFDLEPGTGKLHLDTGSGFVEYAMTEISDGVYDAAFPGAPCATPLAFYFSAETGSGFQGLDPVDAPLDAYQAYAAIDATVLAQHDFETSAGWAVTNQNVSSGAWLRGEPLGDGSRAPADDYDGSGQCWLTGDFFGNFDVDGGPTRLTSENFDIAGLAGPAISYAWWLYNQPQDEDRLSVSLSGDNGQTWVVAEQHAHGGTQWHVGSVNVRDYLPDAETLRVRFSVADNPDDSITEAAIDAFLLADFVCAEDCVADFNGDGSVNTQDVLAFLNAWNAGEGSADINGDGTINTQDVLAFLNLWNAGC